MFQSAETCNSMGSEEALLMGNVVDAGSGVDGVAIKYDKYFVGTMMIGM